LDTISLESFGASVVHVHRQRHRDGAFRVRRPFAVVLVDVQIIGDDAKLLASHLENFVVVNGVYGWISATLGVHGKVAICAAQVASSTPKLESAATFSPLSTARACPLTLKSAASTSARGMQ